MPHLHFTHEPLSVILPAVRAALTEAGEVNFTVPDPDAGLGLYAGETTAQGIHRPWQTWADLADLLGAHLLTPERVGEGRVRVRLRTYKDAPAPDADGYGAAGAWVRVDKLEDPVFLFTLVEALRRVNPPAGGRVLALGVNAGRELDALALAFPNRTFEVVGVDLDETALAAARARHPHASFRVLDVTTLPAPDLGRFDLVLALSLLQSPSIRQDVLLRALRRDHLTPTGGLILGFPNARYRDGFLSYGARLRNFARPDLSLLTADVTAAHRGLQKHGFKVFVTGKYEVLVTAIPAKLPTPGDLEL
ncbi:class I SAM-dependent methyltransferase [Deinococcus metallilatus]|uniref:SAM-dependent methyltransferase n=1 Tax=Deinococcus metallilatus TaxID=1211322 RepID=A0ABR6MW87_9DEIO|nr:class I SAM-dependent methyltransferase [Deinococcus metallilatus]MBB5296151.1 SAM-dependent methyltransferase [Deinococcus metallilatus]GMA14017.1 methyltransferase type 12 [Deinococcus metallilatus]